MFLLLMLAAFQSFILWFGINYPHSVITFRNFTMDVNCVTMALITTIIRGVARYLVFCAPSILNLQLSKFQNHLHFWEFYIEKCAPEWGQRSGNTKKVSLTLWTPPRWCKVWWSEASVSGQRLLSSFTNKQWQADRAQNMSRQEDR